MKQLIRYILTFAVLLISGVGTSWALSASDILKGTVVDGDISFAVSELQEDSYYKVTITAVPNSNYIITKNDFEVLPLVSPGAAPQRAPGLAQKLDVKDGDVKNQFYFNLPKKYHGALVSATFLPPVTPGYYVINKGAANYLKVASANVSITDGEFKFADMYSNDGNAIWALTREGYLQNNTFYLNATNGPNQTLYLSVEPVTRWEQEIVEGDTNKKRIKCGDKYLGNDGSPKLLATAENCYFTCPVTITEVAKDPWTGPTNGDISVQSPQQVTYLRYYFTQKFNYSYTDVTGTVKSANDQSRYVYACLSYKDGGDGKGATWNITNDGIIYSDKGQTADVTTSPNFNLLPADPFAREKHPNAVAKAIKFTIKPKPIAVDASKNYLLFSVKGSVDYRYPCDDGITENDPLKPNGKGGTDNTSILTDPDTNPNQQISWKITMDDNGFYSFQNVNTNHYIYYDAQEHESSEYGVIRVGGATVPEGDAAKKYKFRLYKTTDTDYGTCYQIIPYNKQFAIYKSDGAATGLMSALNVTQYSSNQIISLNAPDVNSTWCIYKYEAEYRVRTDFTISGPTTAAGAGQYTFEIKNGGWYGKYITESPKTGNGQRGLVVNGTYNTDKINYIWTVKGLDGYIDLAGLTQQDGGYGQTNENSSKQTFTVSTLPVSSASGVVQLQLRGGDGDGNPYRYSGKKTLAFTILGNGTVEYTDISSWNELTATGAFRLASDMTGRPAIDTFSGVLDGAGHKITGLDEPLFHTLTNGTVCNLNLKDVNISESGQVGAIARVANGGSRIYNVGILSGQVGSSDGYCGGLVGLLDGSARVINCFSYATITGGTYVGGLVGYNNYKSTATDLRTMVMNCMMYGDMTGGSNRAPVYNGLIIDNLQGGLNNFNYYAYSQLTSEINTYNCALAVEDKYLERFEYYRLLLNSNKKLAAFYATNDAGKANKMAKWVLETANRKIANPMPYPVLRKREQGRFDPSIVNPDVDNAPDSTSVGPDKGGKLGKTLKVTIAKSKSYGGQTWPGGAKVTTPSLTLQRTDKDFERYNFNYDKVQLPYYNQVGEGNYTGNRVVTGWKIKAITAVDDDPYNASNYDYSKTYASNGSYFDAPNYNFADRKSSKKDLYSVSGRIFAQGAYFDVPYGVTEITIEPYWAKAAYIADQNYDVVYKNDYSGKQDVAQTGTQVTVETTMFKEQRIEAKMDNALSYISDTLGGYGPTVYDNAVVLVGNLHLDGVPSNADNPFTMMSVDEDNDREPDYSLIYHHKGRLAVAPIRYDFLNIPGTAQAQKPNGASLVCNGTIYKTKGWFEITNTSSMYFSQFEYENVEESTKADAPLILMGGVIDQFVSTQKTAIAGNTVYLHLGGNLWIHELGLGTHSDGNKATPHVPVSVTGGDYEGFYLTGTYNANAAVQTDNAECYISSGRFGELAGASQEQIDGSVTWQIYNADITSFFGGGTNDAKPITGTITTTIAGSHVGTFCGGPKFGNMSAGKAVSTTATDCTFGTYFGAGYGGNSYSRRKYYDGTGPAWGTTLQGYYTADRGKYYNGTSTNLPTSSYGKKGPGVATDFDYEFFVWSSGQTGGRFFVKFVTFSLAQCNDVSTTLKHCKVTGSFYGGGSLGKVMGNVTSDLEDCEVAGNVFGAGYSATLPKIAVRDEGFTTPPSFNKNSGMFEPAGLSATTDYEWTHVDDYPSEGGAGFSEKQVITTQDLTMTNLGSVEGNVTLNITGSKTTVGGSIYGGGEESVVNGSTTVNVSSGTIGTTGKGGAEFGNVYGGGMGKDDNVMAGLVKGNTNVTISGSTAILHNVYGGGAYGSVGNFDYNDDYEITSGDKNKDATTGDVVSGVCNVTITGGTIGTTGKENGMVFGSSRGDVARPGADGKDPNDKLAWVYDTNVTIGDASSATDVTTPLVKGSVYGSGENGHTYHDAAVNIYSGTIGISSKEDGDGGARYPTRGNVYGGGCGTDTYTMSTGEGESGKRLTYYNPKAGIVLGNTTVTVTGGHVVHNVYGGGAMGSVGTFTEFDADATNDVPDGKPTACREGTGCCTVSITGGKIGLEDATMKAAGGPDDFGHVFGAGRGVMHDPDDYPNLETSAFFNTTRLTIGGTALVCGSVYGGSESGHVLGNTSVTVFGGQIGCGIGAKKVYDDSDFDQVRLDGTDHWSYDDKTAYPYDMYADDDGNYPGVPADEEGRSARNGRKIATDGHTFYGNVFGGGSGYYPYAPGKWLRSAGRVEGSTTVTVTGGHVLNNVYGGCEMADVEGSATVTISGGTVGVPREGSGTYGILANPSYGYVFGAGMGDKRIFFNTSTNVASTKVTVTGGKIFGSVYGGGEDGHVLGDAETSISGTPVIGSVGTTEGYDGNVFGGGQGSHWAKTAGVVGGDVRLKVTGGTMKGSVYGGGRIASVGTHFAMTKIKDEQTGELVDNPNYGKMQADTDEKTHGHITVDLTGGTIWQDVYGGCMGTAEKDKAGNMQDDLGVSKVVTVNLNQGLKDNELGCVVRGNIFGCNNVYGSPQQAVEVHIYGTQNAEATQIANTDAVAANGDQPAKEEVKDAKKIGRYDVKAVYGGGNMAAYKPVTLPKPAVDDNGKDTKFSTRVIIDGCDRTSIGQVYGGGNAASTPATYVEVNGAFEIEELFGGGNGKDDIKVNGVTMTNPGANVGYYAYDSQYDPPASSKTERAQFGYGTGEASVNIYGGTIHRVFGGSNTKGNVRKTALTILDDVSNGCDLCIDEAYGGGKSAPMDAEAKLLMSCLPGLKVAYGGAEAADIQGNVTLNITNGTFDRVFGGNNISGTIHGTITVNVEEIGCKPVIIGQLYGGGNQAAYTAPSGKDGPTVNVRSFTSIGEIYGGGYGKTATVTGDCYVNIDEIEGKYASDAYDEKTKTITFTEYKRTADGGFELDADGKRISEEKTVTIDLPGHEAGTIGAIKNVFGGGNEAKVVGSTNVNIGTKFGENDVVGADIRGNVYGGGNNAEVTGDTNVTIGKKAD